ncbi:hypothetical protein B0H19DRAFT_1069265 [Mycena capillaripes]|nr:hypothetical protein B0H19DRAFT_1069265 [Mycena capillaripes]
MYLTLVHATGSEPITAFPPPVDGPTSTFGYVRLRPPTSVHTEIRLRSATFGYVRQAPGHYLFGRVNQSPKMTLPPARYRLPLNLKYKFKFLMAAPSQYLKSSNIVHAELRCKSNFRSTVRGPKKEGN